MSWDWPDADALTIEEAHRRVAAAREARAAALTAAWWPPAPESDPEPAEDEPQINLFAPAIGG